ncbi:restriction endonuclease [Intrasporangium chromatireducens Q5-1]|uniref:Restriction endonuclease n=1 Tax=Intrasporangium chromatireducens Q5-1 TaxID=584657 RepID=W9GL59_9MICO|nr:DEAD/DEAH box helicase family protein [Intrasporangium chromatireducens]EWT05862.1 restriction endonuclease [Intrasporangium chromatireducens Q5-1]
MTAEQSGRTTEPLDDPVLNGPYDAPTRFFEIGPEGPTGRIIDGRRPSESFIPVPAVRKGRGKASKLSPDDSEQLSLLLTHEQIQRNTLINGLRHDLEIWRASDYRGATATSTKLLHHWADSHRDNRILFAQREAAETAIFLAEVSGRVAGFRDWRPDLEEQNAEHNAGLPRVALKMATGSGKTVVMAMLIAWQTLNKITGARGNSRYAKRFLIITPGITIRDRLRVLQPNDPENYYDKRGLVPPDLRGLLGKAQILVTNYHAFLLKDAKEIEGVSRTTRQILLAGRKDDPFKETEDAMVSRVLRGWGVGSGKRQSDIIVINDEAHHCYMDKPITVEAEEAGVEKGAKEDADRNIDARVWFKGIQAIARKVGVKSVYDLSATPFYLAGSGYKEGFIFPWTVSDFSLMDAIECGIVKVPRIPVDDNADIDTVTFLNLWDLIDKQLPKRARADTDISNWTPPAELEAALFSLYRSYERAYDNWTRTLAPLDEPPPVFIVVCPNTAVSKLVYDWIAGGELSREDGSPVLVDGKLALFSNTDGDRLRPKPHTILVDSAQLESGEAMKKEFKDAAAAEIDAFKAEYRLRNPGADVDSLTDEDLLREVMNTVGKKGRLGEGIRCVVSVAMLTEGWDANTVTHILGIRAFRSQLLCEQVVGRGLRRRSYAVNDEGRFDAEYANVYGVPFAFIPNDKPLAEPKPPKPVTLVQTVAGREHLRITFPKLDGYRIEVPDELLYLPDNLEPFVIGPGTVPTWTEAAPIVGAEELVQDDPASMRAQAIAYRLATRLVRTHFALGDIVDETGVRAEPRPWLFPNLVTLCRGWLEQAVDVAPGFHLGYISKYALWEAKAADAVYAAITRVEGDRRPRLRPMLRRYDPVGTTGKVSFPTRKVALPSDPTRSEVSHVVLDGPDGNTWEQLLMAYAEHSPHVAAYVKNDHLGFTIPYLHEGRSHDYVPDFLLRLKRQPVDEVDRVLIVEVSGGQKSAHSPGSVKTKAATARNSWCPAVNNHGGFGRWGYTEITDPTLMTPNLDAAIASLYADEAIIGDADLLDLQETRRGAHA